MYLDMTSSIRFLPLHIHYIANDFGKPIIFIMNLMFIFSSKLFITHGSRVESTSVTPPYLSFSFFTWFCHLYLFLYPRLPGFLWSVAFLTMNVFLIPISSLICGNFLFRNSSLYLCVSRLFKNRWDLLPATSHKRHLFLSVTPSHIVLTIFLAWSMLYHLFLA